MKPQLPVFYGDGRVSSSADGEYETTRTGSTAEEDLKRRRAMLRAIGANRCGCARWSGCIPTSDCPPRHPTASYASMYNLLVGHLTNPDSVGHRLGTANQNGAENAYEESVRDVTRFITELMGDLPPHTVLLVAADHGHEVSGGTGGTSRVVTELPLFSYRRSVQHSATRLEIEEIAHILARLTGRPLTSVPAVSPTDTSSVGAAAPSPPAPIRSDVRMIDLAATLSLLAGVPMPRHSEGYPIAQMFENAPRLYWKDHARDLLYQRYHYVRALLTVEALEGEALELPSLESIEMNALAAIAAGAPTGTMDYDLWATITWFTQLEQVEQVLDKAKEALALRYGSRNLVIVLVLLLLLVSVQSYVLIAMTLADPVYIFTYRRYAHESTASYWKVPDVIALCWAVAIVLIYYFITITVYLALMQGTYGYSAFDSSHVHDVFSRRRYLIAALLPGIVCQWALTRSFTVWYRQPLKRKPRTGRESPLLLALRGLVKLRLLLSAQVESREVCTVYLIRLYLAAVSVFATFFIFLCSATVSFPLPYMFQPTHLDESSWESRFQTLTFKLLSLPLLLGAAYNLYVAKDLRVPWEMRARCERGGRCDLR